MNDNPANSPSDSRSPQDLSSDPQTLDQSAEEQSTEKRSLEEHSAIVDVRDLVYKGGFDGDPREILANPAVAPQPLDDGREERIDVFRDAEEMPSPHIESE